MGEVERVILADSRPITFASDEGSDWDLQLGDLPARLPAGSRVDFGDLSNNAVFRAICWRRRQQPTTNWAAELIARALLLIFLCTICNFMGIVVYLALFELLRNSQQSWKRLEAGTGIPVILWRGVLEASLDPGDIARGLWAGEMSRASVRRRKVAALAGIAVSTIAIFRVYVYEPDEEFLVWFIGVCAGVLVGSAAYFAWLNFAPFHVLPLLRRETETVRATVELRTGDHFTGQITEGCTSIYLATIALLIGSLLMMLFGIELDDLDDKFLRPGFAVTITVACAAFGAAIGAGMGFYAKQGAPEFLALIKGDVIAILQSLKKAEERGWERTPPPPKPAEEDDEDDEHSA